MATRKEFVTGWINTSVHDFLDEIEGPVHSMSSTLITCLDSDPDVVSVFRFLEGKKGGPFRIPRAPIGPGVLVPTRSLIAANRRRRLFFGFDEVWFFPGRKIAPKPDELTITRPGLIDPRELDRHIGWMRDNQCSLGLGDGEGMNYCLKVQGVARFVVRAFNESTMPSA